MRGIVVGDMSILFVWATLVGSSSWWMDGGGVVHGFSTPSVKTNTKNKNSNKWLSNLFFPAANKKEQDDTVKGYKGSNGEDEEYPYYFRGRLWFRPALVRSTSTSSSPSSVVKLVSLFGWTVGGVVALEYDESPVGPYNEYVTMGSLVSSSKSLVGQWGSRLYVSTPEAERVCQQIWNVPAEYATIQFTETTQSNNNNNNNDPFLNVSQPPSSSSSSATSNKKGGAPTMIEVDNWSQTRVLSQPPNKEKDSQRLTLPVIWTPSIKALWAPFLSLPSLFDTKKNEDNDELPFHQLRLSAGAIRLTWCPQESSPLLGIPIGIGLIVDDVLIEISPPKGTF